MKNIVVFGANGFLGRNICEYLSQNNKIYAVVRPHSQVKINITNNIKIIECDIFGDYRYDSLFEQIKECDACIFLCWEGNKNSLLDAENINNISANKLIKLFDMMALQYPKAIYIQMGSAAEYGLYNGTVTEDVVCKPVSEYGKAKLRFFKEAKEHSINNHIKFAELRMHSIIGKYDYQNKLIYKLLNKMIKNERVQLTTDCKQIWNFIAVEDVCKLVEKIIYQGTLKYFEYNVGAATSRPLREYILELASIMDVSINQIQFGNNRSDSYNFVYDSKRIQNEFAWISKIDFKEMIQQLVKS